MFLVLFESNDKKVKIENQRIAESCAPARITQRFSSRKIKTGKKLPIVTGRYRCL